MTAPIPADTATGYSAHDHIFLGTGHARNERRTWFVILLCGIMMVIEIVGGLAYGSIALVADGLHMSTHAGALLLAAMAYTYARRYAQDDRFSFGTGKFGDLAGFTSAIVLLMIALLIGYESVMRAFSPVQIHYNEALTIAVIGLLVNVASVWLLSGGHDHHHGHGHAHSDDHDDAPQMIETAAGPATLTIFEDGVPPRFRLAGSLPLAARASEATIETVRADGARQTFLLEAHDGYLESRDAIPEPHAFAATLRLADATHEVRFDDHAHGHPDHHRDNNMRAAIVHVMADAAVSVLVIIGLLAAKIFGWLWMDPMAGVIGAVVIVSWSYGLVRDTGAILLDMMPDRRLAGRIQRSVEAAGDTVRDLHLWRLGPGHLGAIVSIAAQRGHDLAFYRSRLESLPIAHLTVEIETVA